MAATSGGESQAPGSGGVSRMSISSTLGSREAPWRAASFSQW